jgi:hypothetical protein
LTESRTQQEHTMDIELINALGTRIADLTQRTQELRRYL